MLAPIQMNERPGKADSREAMTLGGVQQRESVVSIKRDIDGDGLVTRLLSTTDGCIPARATMARRQSQRLSNV